MAAGESERNVGKSLADGGADTSVVGTGWNLFHQTKWSALIQGFSNDLIKQDKPIVSAVTVVDFPKGGSVILQAQEALYLPKNK